MHQLAAAREAVVVVTLRREAGAPDALAALWKDELCERIGLRELGREDVERLLDEMLGGPVERRSANALWELTRGNVQFLRELVRYGRDHGLLVDAGGVWCWNGATIAVGTRLADLVDLRLEDLDAAQRRVLELVAAARLAVPRRPCAHSVPRPGHRAGARNPGRRRAARAAGRGPGSGLVARGRRRWRAGGGHRVGHRAGGRATAPSARGLVRGHLAFMGAAGFEPATSRV